MMHGSCIKVCLALFLRATPIFVTTDFLPRRGCFSLTPRWLKGREASRQPSWGKMRAIQLGRRPCRSPYNRVISGSTVTWSPTKQCRTGQSPRRPAPAVAVTVHHGVNEKQPLRGNKSVVMKNGPVVRGFLIKSIVNLNERAVIMLELLRFQGTELFGCRASALN